MSTAPKFSDPKERILKTADRLFYEQGYLATGVNQIIAEAQVAKASFYQHFPSKEDLAIAYLEMRNAALLKRVRQVVESQQDPKMRVLALFSLLRNFAEQTNFRGCAFLNMTAEFPDRRSHVREIIIQHKTALRNYIETLIRAALPDEPEETVKMKANTTFLLLEGSLVESQNYGNIWPIQAAEIAVQQLLNSNY